MHETASAADCRLQLLGTVIGTCGRQSAQADEGSCDGLLLRVRQVAAWMRFFFFLIPDMPDNLWNSDLGYDCIRVMIAEPAHA